MKQPDNNRNAAYAQEQEQPLSSLLESVKSYTVPGMAIWPLRLFLGISFIWASFDKLRDPQFLDPSAMGFVGKQIAPSLVDSPIGGLIAAMLPLATLLGIIVMAGELLIGVATLLGWFTRFSALMGLLINLMFYLTITWDIRPFYYGADIVFVVGWLTLLLTGPGPLSVDAYLRRHSKPPQQAVMINQQAGKRAMVRDVAPAEMSGAVSRRRFNVMALSAVVGGVVFLLDGAAWPILHSGSKPALAQLPGQSPTTATSATSSSAIQPTATSDAANLGNPPPQQPQPTDTPGAAMSGQLLAAAGSLPVNQSLNFTDPTTGGPAVLVHLTSGYAAYSAICTHQGCTVQYDSQQTLLACPCHGALFDPASNGAVVRRPARLPLSAIPVTVAPDGGVYLAG